MFAILIYRLFGKRSFNHQRLNCLNSLLLYETVLARNKCFFCYNLAAIEGPEINDEEPLVEDDDAQLELQLALERYKQSVQHVFRSVWSATYTGMPERKINLKMTVRIRPVTSVVLLYNSGDQFTNRLAL